MSVRKLLELLRAQNGALLSRRTAEVLSAFLQGYALARAQAGCPEDERHLEAFNLWVHREFKIEGGPGWAKVVAFQSSSEAEEWKLFWKLYDEYERRRARKQAPAVGAAS